MNEVKTIVRDYLREMCCIKFLDIYAAVAEKFEKYFV